METSTTNTSTTDAMTVAAIAATKAIINDLHGAEALRASGLARAMHVLIQACEVERVRDFVALWADPTVTPTKDQASEARQLILSDVFRVATRAIDMGTGRLKLVPSEAFGTEAERKDALKTLQGILANAALRVLVWRALSLIGTKLAVEEVEGKTAFKILKATSMTEVSPKTRAVRVIGALAVQMKDVVSEDVVISTMFTVGRKGDGTFCRSFADMAKAAASWVPAGEASRSTGGSQGNGGSSAAIGLESALDAASTMLHGTKGKLSEKLADAARAVFVQYALKVGIMKKDKEGRLSLPARDALFSLMQAELAAYNASCGIDAPALTGTEG